MSQTNMRRRLYTPWLVARSLFCYLLTAVLALITFPPACALAMLLPSESRYRSRLLFFFLRGSCWAVCRGFLLRITIEGAEHIPAAPAIVVANHTSSLDIPLLGYLIPGPHLWYALDRFFSTPVLGMLLRRIAIPVDQDHPVRAARALLRGVSIARGYHMYSLLFPEGGRYTDGEIHPFFAGFSVLARKLRSPVIPVMLYNAGRVYPPGSFIIRPHVVRIVVGVPFVYEENETDTQFAERVRGWFQQRTNFELEQ